MASLLASFSCTARSFRVAAIGVAAVVVIVCGVRAQGVSCAGDCNGDLHVSIDELEVGVGIALGFLPVSACKAFDSDAHRSVEVDELVQGVKFALDESSCAATDDGTSTASPTQDPMATPTIARGSDEGGCFHVGCSSAVCWNDRSAITTCEWYPQYECYRYARCAPDPVSGTCSFQYQPGDPAHQCLLKLGFCVFDTDCSPGLSCVRDKEQQVSHCVAN